MGNGTLGIMKKRYRQECRLLPFFNITVETSYVDILLEFSRLAGVVKQECEGNLEEKRQQVCWKVCERI